MEGIKNKIIYFYILYFMKKKSMIINIIFNAIKTVLNLLFPLITFPYASRVLGVENIGLVQYYNSIISYFILFAGLGVSYYAVREGTKYRDDKDSLSKFSSELISILLITTFISYIMLFIIFFTNRSSFDEKLLVISSLSIMFSSLSLEWIYQIKEDFVYISLRSFCFHIISFISLILFVKSKNDYYIEGMSICGKIYKQKCSEIDNTINQSIKNLRNTTDEKDKVINELREIINKYKNERKKEKSNTETEVNNHMELLQECMEVFEEENISNLPSIIR